MNTECKTFWMDGDTVYYCELEKGHTGKHRETVYCLD